MNKLPLESEKRFPFAGIQFYSGTTESVVKIIHTWILQEARTYVCVTGVHGVAMTDQDKGILRAHTHATLVVPDGMPIVWVGRLSGYSSTHRIYGPDLMLSVCRMAEQKNYHIYLYGTTQRTLVALRKELLGRYPRLIICGEYAPPFGHITMSERQRIIRSINHSGAQIVFVGLSTPKQEVWMHDFRPEIHANVLIGVGAAFDFISNTKHQAPLWMRQSGTEWMFRLIQEPARLWRRYINAVWVFPKLLFRHFFRV